MSQCHQTMGFMFFMQNIISNLSLDLVVGYVLARFLTILMSPPPLISLVVTLSSHTLNKTNNALCKVNSVELFASLLRNSKSDQLHNLH